MQNCKECLNGTKCKICNDNYFVKNLGFEDDGSCEPVVVCMPNCLACESATSCTTPADGYYFSDIMRKCGSLYEGVKSCKTCENSLVCTVPMEGYYL